MYFLAKKLRVEDYDVLIDPTEVLRNRDLFFIKNINAKLRNKNFFIYLHFLENLL